MAGIFASRNKKNSKKQSNQSDRVVMTTFFDPQKTEVDGAKLPELERRKHQIKQEEPFSLVCELYDDTDTENYEYAQRVTDNMVRREKSFFHRHGGKFLIGASIVIGLALLAATVATGGLALPAAILIAAAVMIIGGAASYILNRQQEKRMGLGNRM